MLKICATWTVVLLLLAQLPEVELGKRELACKRPLEFWPMKKTCLWASVSELDWYTARKFCVLPRANHMVTIHNADQMHALQGYLNQKDPVSPYKTYHVGCSYHGNTQDWRWPDDTPVDASLWGKGESTVMEDKYCCSLQWFRDDEKKNHLISVSCSTRHPFICEKYK